MKSIRLISLVLVLIVIGCSLIACDTDDTDMELPERAYYDMTFSFQIKDETGRNIVDAVNYNYRGHEDPTILNVITDYLAIEADYGYTIDNNNILVSVGKAKANAKNGDYWAFMKGTGHDVQAILADANLQKKNFIDGKMSEYTLKDGDSFTVVLVKAKG